MHASNSHIWIVACESQISISWIILGLQYDHKIIKGIFMKLHEHEKLRFLLREYYELKAAYIIQIH